MCVCVRVSFLFSDLVNPSSESNADTPAARKCWCASGPGTGFLVLAFGVGLQFRV